MLPDKVRIVGEEEHTIICKCGGELTSLDGDHVNLKIGGDYKGIGWMIWHWDCATCGLVTTLSLGVVSDPQDDEVAFDNFQHAESTQFVQLEVDGVTIPGQEDFQVIHENPLAGFQSRVYRVMSEYSIGPFECKKQLKEFAEKVGPILIARTQVVLANSQALKRRK